MSLGVQAYTLFLMLLSGVALGVAFDSYRVTLNQLNIRRPLVHAVDFLYWLVATWLVFRLLYYANSGEVRVFVFLGLLLGLSMYFALISYWVIRSVQLMIRAIRQLLRWCIQLVELLVLRPFKFIYRCGFILFGFLTVISIFFYKIMIQLVYPFWKILIWLTKPIHRSFSFMTSWRGRWKATVQWIKGRFGRKE